jgi:RNA polymerase sigma-70 factor (ECF subfamily)
LWLQPFPDRLLDVEDGGDEPDTVAVSRETIELAFLAAVQHLPPRPRAVLILRDVLGWSAKETADVLDGTVASVNSALQRARARMQQLGRPGRLAFTPIVEPNAAERELVQRYMDAHERADAEAVIDLLGEDVRFSMPPQDERYEGRDAVAGFLRTLFGDGSPGEWRLVATRANGRPAVANYIRAPGEDEFRAVVLDVLRIEDGALVEITSFTTDTFATFDLPAIWSAA